MNLLTSSIEPQYFHLLIFALFPFSTIAQCFCRSFTEQLMRFTKRTFYLLPFIPIRSLFWLTKINCSRSHLFGCVYVRKMENRSLCRLLSEDSQMIFSCSGIYIYISLEFRTVVFLGECIERLFTQNCICIVHITASVFVWISNWKAVGRLVCYASSCCCCWFGSLLLLLSDDWLPFFLSIHICELTVLPLNRIAQQTTTVPLVYREHSCDIDVLWIWRTSKFHSLTLCFDTIIWISKREHCYREISVERQ